MCIDASPALTARTRAGPRPARRPPSYISRRRMRSCSKSAAGWDAMGLLSKDEQELLDDASRLIEKARTSRPDRASSAWAKAAEYLERNRLKVTDRRSDLADKLVEVGSG